MKTLNYKIPKFVFNIFLIIVILGIAMSVYYLLLFPMMLKKECSQEAFIYVQEREQKSESEYTSQARESDYEFAYEHCFHQNGIDAD